MDSFMLSVKRNKNRDWQYILANCLAGVSIIDSMLEVHIGDSYN